MTATTPTALEALREAIPESARDIKVNLQTVLQPGEPLSPAQRWGVAVAAALAARNSRLREALVAEARRAVAAEVVDDALAAAALMAMTNVFYRFRHFVEKASYDNRPARLRMQRLARPATSQLDFELFSLAASAVNGCAVCVRAHEEAVLRGGLTEDHVYEAVRVAATVHAAAVALELAP